jgi:hypothetical protein
MRKWSRHSRTDRADDPLHEGILPGRAWGGQDLANRHALDSPHKLIAVDTVTITKQVGRSRIIRERLDELPSCPGGSGMVGDVEVEEFAAAHAAGRRRRRADGR